PPIGSKHDRFGRDLTLYPPQFLLKHFTITQLRQRPALGFRLNRAACQQPFVTIIQVLRQFINDGRLTRRLQLQARQPPSDLLLPPTVAFWAAGVLSLPATNAPQPLRCPATPFCPWGINL